MALERLIISCGGTGGHFFPGLSVARIFREKGGDVLLLLSGVHAPAQKEIAEKNGIKAVALPEMPHYSKRPLRFISGFCRGYRAAKREIKNFKPQAMLGMGSFAALPVVWAAVRSKIPLFVHDGNARIGKANRFFSRWAKFVCSAFPAVNAEACRCPVYETGMPVRPELLKVAGLDKKTALAAVNREFGTSFSAEKPLILVTGGSQGAAVFNGILPKAFIKNGGDFQVFHLTGKGKLDDAEANYAGAEFRHKLLESTDKMAELLAASDLVFSRSGGSTAAELALFGKPAVFIPYPYAAEGHQTDNAGYFADAGAALLVANEEFTVDRAGEIIGDFLENRDKWLQMSEKMRKKGMPDAAELLIAKISGMTD